MVFGAIECPPTIQYTSNSCRSILRASGSCGTVGGPERARAEGSARTSGGDIRRWPSPFQCSLIVHFCGRLLVKRRAAPCRHQRAVPSKASQEDHVSELDSPPLSTPLSPPLPYPLPYPVQRPINTHNDLRNVSRPKPTFQPLSLKKTFCSKNYVYQHYVSALSKNCFKYE